MSKIERSDVKTSENIDIEHKISLRGLPVLPLFLKNNRVDPDIEEENE